MRQALRFLEAIGAVQGVSDSVLGSQAWCPITSLDSADEAYEWMMGTTRSDLTDEEQSVSDSLTVAYAEYINSIGLTDSEGNALTLEESEDGRYQSGTYYEYMVSVIEESLNNFLADTTFPYDSSSASGGFGGMGGGHGHGGGRPDGENGGFGGGRPDGNGEGFTGEMPEGVPGQMGENAAAGGNTEGGEVDFTAIDDISRTENNSGVTISGTFETVQD